MKKDKELKYLRELIIVCFILIVCMSGVLKNSYTNLDEFWIFNFAKNMADGLVPYKEFNMITTPLLPIICGFLMRIFGIEFFTMRIIAIILLTCIFYVSYLILKKITNKDVAVLGLVLILLGFKDFLCIDYNYMVLFIGLLLTYIEISRKKDFFASDIKYDFLVGVLAGIAIWLKQTTGLFLAIACIGYKIFKIRKKEDIKVFVKIALIRFLGVCVPIILLILYLLLNNCMKDFIDYALLGVTEFTNKKLYIDLIMDKKYYSLLAIIIPMTLIQMFIGLFKKDTKKDIYILFAYSLSTSIVIYPISDTCHFLIGILISFISLIYVWYEIFVENLDYEKISQKARLSFYGIFSFLLIFSSLTVGLSSVKDLWRNYIKADKENELNHLTNVVECVGLKDRINLVDDYILSEKKIGKNVYILDAEAAIYNMPLDIYYKDYDMLLIGNIGKNGEEKLINRIKEEKNAVYLVNRLYMNWQTPMKVRSFVIENLKKVGEISIFDIYELNV